MKKYIFALAALACGLFSGCTNDEIEIIDSKESTITVNPASVIANIKELKAGDIYNFGNFKLRVRSLIYNNEGELVSTNVKEVNSYQTNVSFTPILATGTYTVVTTTDMTGPVNTSDGVNEYWALKNADKIQTLTLESTGYIGHHRKILGTSINTLTVTSSGGTLTVNPQMNGSLILVYLNDFPNTNLNIDGEPLTRANFATLELNKSVAYSGGELVSNFETTSAWNSYRLWTQSFEGLDGTYYNYDYEFVLATDKIHLGWTLLTENNYAHLNCLNASTGQEMTEMTLEKGKQYATFYSLSSEDDAYNSPWFGTFDEFVNE